MADDTAVAAPEEWTAEQRSLADKIRNQVEFYFSDSNYRQDKFLRGEAEKEEQGFVPLGVIASFKRMQALSEDLDFIAKSLKDSNTVVLCEETKRVRRADPLPEEDTSASRTVYAKFVPKDATLDEIIAFFAKFGAVNCVRMRKMEKANDDGVHTFKGTCLVEYATEEEAKKVVEMKGLKFREEGEGSEKALFLQWKSEWQADKEGQKNKKRKEPPPKNPEAIVKFTNIGADLDRHAVKELFEKSDNPVQFVELITDDEGNKHGFVRMLNAPAAEAVVEYLTNEKVEFGGKLPELTVLRGEESDAYWAKIKNTKGSGGGRGGRGGGRGRPNKRGRKK